MIVVEGCFDCLRVRQAGFRCVVALMGCALSMEQERLLLEFRRLVLMLDGDPAGRVAAQRLSARLPGKCWVAVVELSDAAQQDRLPPEIIRGLLQDSIEGADKDRGSVDAR